MESTAKTPPGSNPAAPAMRREEDPTLHSEQLLAAAAQACAASLPVAFSALAHLPRLTPRNHERGDGGTPTFVSTFVRAERLPSAELADLNSAVVFVSRLFPRCSIAEHSDDTLQPPSTTLALRRGSRRDVALTLASILLGAGFDALVVEGWAPAWLADGETERLNYPFPTVHASGEEQVGGGGLDAPPPAEADCAGTAAGELEHAAGVCLRGPCFGTPPAPEQPECEGSVGSESGSPAATGSGVATAEVVHTWVLVREGARGVTRPLYIEPLLGAVVEVGAPESPFQHVSVLWNAKNAWVNTQHIPLIDRPGFGLASSTGLRRGPQPRSVGECSEQLTPAELASPYAALMRLVNLGDPALAGSAAPVASTSSPAPQHRGPAGLSGHNEGAAPLPALDVGHTVPDNGPDALAAAPALSHAALSLLHAPPADQLTTSRGGAVSAERRIRGRPSSGSQWAAQLTEVSERLRGQAALAVGSAGAPSLAAAGAGGGLRLVLEDANDWEPVITPQSLLVAFRSFQAAAAERGGPTGGMADEEVSCGSRSGGFARSTTRAVATSRGGGRAPALDVGTGSGANLASPSPPARDEAAADEGAATTQAERAFLDQFFDATGYLRGLPCRSPPLVLSAEPGRAEEGLTPSLRPSAVTADEHHPLGPLGLLSLLQPSCTRYARVKVETWPPGLHPERLVYRVTSYANPACVMIDGIAEAFLGRADLLHQRVRTFPYVTQQPSSGTPPHRQPKRALVEERFLTGRGDGLSRFSCLTGSQQDLVFYPGTRVDGVLRWRHVIGRKVCQVLAVDSPAPGQGGDRKTVRYRSASFASRPRGRGAAALLGPSARAAISSATVALGQAPPASGGPSLPPGTVALEIAAGSELVIRKMAEKCVLPPAGVQLPGLGTASLLRIATCGMPVEPPALLSPSSTKITYDVQGKRIRVRTTAASGQELCDVTYRKLGGADDQDAEDGAGVDADGSAPAQQGGASRRSGGGIVSAFQKELNLVQLLVRERECIAAMRVTTRLMNEITANRGREDAAASTSRTAGVPSVQHTDPALPGSSSSGAFVVAHLRAMRGDPVSEEKQVEVTGAKFDTETEDLLEQVIRTAKLQDPSHPTEKEARKIAKEARAAYQERLLERVAIVQRHLDAENEKLLRQQQSFSRSTVHAEDAEVDFEKLCAEATFRIGILEQRLERQEATARSKFGALEALLSEDPRLQLLGGKT